MVQVRTYAPRTIDVHLAIPILVLAVDLSSVLSPTGRSHPPGGAWRCLSGFGADQVTPIDLLSGDPTRWRGRWGHSAAVV